MSHLGEVLWIVDLNRQSLDRVVPDVQIHRLQGMFEAAGWQVLTAKWGRGIVQLFERAGGSLLRERLESMPNEEYQRLLRVDSTEVADRILEGHDDPTLRSMLAELEPEELALAIRDLGGHDLDLLRDTYRAVDPQRPSVIFAYTVKGRGLPIEGHPNNHSAQLSESQMAALATACGTDLASPWRPLPAGPAADLCARRGTELRRTPIAFEPASALPRSLDRPHRAPISTQAALGRFLTDLLRAVPAVGARVVTCSPDVAASTNLGGWINKTGVWSVEDRRDWFADDRDRVLRWTEVSRGQHIELGIAEVNLVGLLGELGATWSRWGRRLIPVATIYDPFIARALEPWSYGIYAGGQSIIIGTPSGVTLAAEGGAHQSITTPSIGLEQPGCVAWEPAFAQDLEWTMLAAMDQVGREGGTSSYFRLSTRPIDPAIAHVPEDASLRERRRRHAVAGGYRLTDHDPSTDQVTLVGVGAIMPEVVEAAAQLESMSIRTAVVCLTSPDLVFRSLQGRGRLESGSGRIVDTLFPADHPTPIVSVMDGHPHTLSFLGSIRGDRTCSLGVTDFGQSSDLEAAYEIHGIDSLSIASAALALLGR